MRKRSSALSAISIRTTTHDVGSIQADGTRVWCMVHPRTNGLTERMRFGINLRGDLAKLDDAAL
jgi:hypothetical protein